MKTRILPLLVALAMALPLLADRPPRVALVVGNSNYVPPEDPLAKNKNIPVAVDDAEAIALELEELGFKIIPAPDATVGELRDAIKEFQEALGTKGGEGVVYYSGHGATFQGHNFLIPVGIPPTTTPETFEKDAVAVREIYEALRSAKARIGVVLLDACRTSAFHVDHVEKGLHEPAGDEVSSSLVTGFADQPGKAVAASVDGEHSAYAKAILQHIGTAGLTLEEFFIEVGNSVDVSSKQQPWQSSAQRAQFYFRPPIYLEVWGDEADDDLIVTAGLDTYIRSVDGPSKRMRLRPGKNVVTAFVVNHRSKTGGELLPEGWSYTLRTNVVNGPAGPFFSATEPETPVPRSRWGRTFVVARAVVTVGQRAVRFDDDPEDAVWVDGFSALAVPGDDLYAAAKWAVLSQGVPVYDNATEETKRDPAVLRENMIRAHDGAAEHRAGLGVSHKSHSDMRRLLAITSDAEIEEAVRRIRDEVSIPVIGEHLRAVCGGNRRQLCVAFRRNAQWAALRALYLSYQQTNFEARNLLGILSNRELRNLYDSIFGAEN